MAEGATYDTLEPTFQPTDVVVYFMKNSKKELGRTPWDTTIGALQALVVSKDGDTMTGALQVPELHIGAESQGFGAPATATVTFTLDGMERFRWLTTGEVRGATTPVGFNNITPAVQYHGSAASAASLGLFRWINSSAGPNIYLGKSRGGGPGDNAPVQTGDNIGRVTFLADGSPGFSGGFRSVEFSAYIGCVSAGNAADGGTGRILDLVFAPAASGGAATPRLKVKGGGDITDGSDNVLISSARHPRLRSYTVAGLPSAANAGEMIFVSNETGGAVPAFSDGTNWRRMTDRAIVS